MPNRRPHLLPDIPAVAPDFRHKVEHDFTRFIRSGLPIDLEAYLLAAFGVDVTAVYAGFPIKNPWGKGSGQLSMRLGQIEEAGEAGLGFVILKTVIAQDASGDRSMDAWAIKESRMVAERILGKESGVEGWTISWKGRGWWHSFDDYLELVRESVRVGRDAGMLIVPSVKYHLPARDEEGFRVNEYTATTQAIYKAYQSAGTKEPMPLEKDFSPTLAGSDRSKQRARISEWLAQVPDLIRSGVPPESVRVVLKMFNSLEDDRFQLELLSHVHAKGNSDYLVYANRLFDPNRWFEGHQGIAYGGPDLSDRNLRILSAFRKIQSEHAFSGKPIPIGGTGDIHSGKMAVEYALRGCTSFQLHTLFQLPNEEFAMTQGGKLERVLHNLYFHPEHGFLIWLRHAANRLGIGEAGTVRFLDIAARGASSALEAVDLDA